MVNPAAPAKMPNAPRRRGAVAYLWAAVVCAATTLLTLPLLGHVDLANIVMLFLLAVALVALRLGSGPAVFAAVLGVVMFDFFFVQPRLSLTVADSQYLITFGVMLAVGLAIGQLTAGQREKAEQASAREAETQALYTLARDLAGAFAPGQTGEIIATFLAARLHVDARLWLPASDGGFVAHPPLPQGASSAQSRVAETYARGETMLFAAGESQYEPGIALPLRSAQATRGVLLAHCPDAGGICTPDARRVLDVVASLAAIAVERLHYSEVAQQATVAVESERLRNALLAAVSHDLRTPLTVLVGLADALALRVPDGEATADATAIRDQALRLSAQVNKLLDMARLRTGNVVLRREWQPLEEVVGSTLAHFEGLPGVGRIEVGKLDGLPWLSLDAVLFERVLCNLVENALKHAPTGPIRLAAAADGDTVEITLTDTGPGIATGDEERVFGLFERGGGERGGVGLGLPISRAIVAAHGGSIVATNQPGGGACFRIRLPAGEAPSLEGMQDD